MLVEAVVIKKNPLREHDQLVTLYSRELGKITASARSSMKPHSVQALQLDEGNVIRCELVSGKGGSIITGAQSIRCFSGAKGSLVRLAAMRFFLQAMDAIVFEQQQDAALFECLQRTLDELDRASDAQALAVFRRQQGALLDVLGYGTPVAGQEAYRTGTDDLFEQIAQRSLGTLDLFYGLAGPTFS